MNNKDKKNLPFKPLAKGEEYVYMPFVRPSQERRAILRMVRDALPPEVWERIQENPLRREPREIPRHYQPSGVSTGDELPLRLDKAMFITSAELPKRRWPVPPGETPPDENNEEG